MTLSKKILLQGVTDDSHFDAIQHILEIDQPERIIMCVAFVNEAGLSILQDSLVHVADKTTIIAGIRNDITSAQGLLMCLQLGCLTYVADIGHNAATFHPKIYLSRNAHEARLLIGSANLTQSGLLSNIEASILLTLDIAQLTEASFSIDLEKRIDRMVVEYSENVVQISDSAAVQELLRTGRVVDEKEFTVLAESSSSPRHESDKTPAMRLRTKQIRRPLVQRIHRMAETPSDQLSQNETDDPNREGLILEWESNPLKERDLCIPTGPNTNPTGSMLFKKGALENIDQRHYFREELFANLEWTFDPRPKRNHIERAEALFHFVILGVDAGVHSLLLSHNTKTDTKSYEQRNSMTQLHWGGAKGLVAREDLLGRKMYLYRDEYEEEKFVLRID